MPGPAALQERWPTRRIDRSSPTAQTSTAAQATMAEVRERMGLR
jgi:hypothetical protein